MSRLIRKPIEISKGIEVRLGAGVLEIKSGSKSSVFSFPAMIDIILEGANLFVRYAKDLDVENLSAKEKAMFGTLYSNVKNVVSGFVKAFEKKLSLVGVGYKAQLTGNDLVLNVGYSHPVTYKMPPDVLASVPVPTDIVLVSSDKVKLGQVAAEIRNIRPPEPYQGKGIRYVDEVIYMKEAKKK